MLRSAQEVERLRSSPTVLENLGVGHGPANVVVEKAAQALGEHVRVSKAGFWSRLLVCFRGSHVVTPWMIEHAVGQLSKYIVGAAGRTHCEPWKGRMSMLDWRASATKGEREGQNSGREARG